MSRHNRVVLQWRVAARSSEPEPSDQIAAFRRLLSYSDDVDWEAHDIEGIAIPAVGNNDAAMHPLATWFAVLYGMSMLARYSPATWVATLDPDRSLDAERIRHGLDIALDVLPALVVLRALGGE